MDIYKLSLAQPFVDNLPTQQLAALSWTCTELRRIAIEQVPYRKLHLLKTHPTAARWMLEHGGRIGQNVKSNNSKVADNGTAFTPDFKYTKFAPKTYAEYCNAASIFSFKYDESEIVQMIKCDTSSLKHIPETRNLRPKSIHVFLGAYPEGLRVLKETSMVHPIPGVLHRFVDAVEKRECPVNLEGLRFIAKKMYLTYDELKPCANSFKNGGKKILFVALSECLSGADAKKLALEYGGSMFPCMVPAMLRDGEIPTPEEMKDIAKHIDIKFLVNGLIKVGNYILENEAQSKNFVLLLIRIIEAGNTDYDLVGKLFSAKNTFHPKEYCGAGKSLPSAMVGRFVEMESPLLPRFDWLSNIVKFFGVEKLLQYIVVPFDNAKDWHSIGRALRESCVPQELTAKSAVKMLHFCPHLQPTDPLLNALIDVIQNNVQKPQ